MPTCPFVLQITIGVVDDYITVLPQAYGPPEGLDRGARIDDLVTFEHLADACDFSPEEMHASCKPLLCVLEALNKQLRAELRHFTLNNTLGRELDIRDYEIRTSSVNALYWQHRINQKAP